MRAVPVVLSQYKYFQSKRWVSVPLFEVEDKHQIEEREELQVHHSVLICWGEMITN